MTTPIRIVGIGSHHGNDSAGWDYVAALKDSSLPETFPAETVSLHQSRTPAHLFELLSGCELAIIIDAIPGEPGTITSLHLNDLASQPNQFSVHGIGLAEALSLLQTLMDPPPQSTILAIGTDPTQHETTDCNTLDSTTHQLHKVIKQIITTHLSS
jgi:hydrogenase maturation protease